jgi:hypothetical protein
MKISTQCDFVSTLKMESRVNSHNFDQGARIICLGNITEMNELQS